MKKEYSPQIRDEILSCEKKLKELAPYIKTNGALAVIYNQTLVQKAILKASGEKKKTLFDKIKKTFTFNRHKKLICDYFME